MTDSEKKVSHVSHFCKFYDTPPSPPFRIYAMFCYLRWAKRTSSDPNCHESFMINQSERNSSTFVLLKAFAIKKE